MWRQGLPPQEVSAKWHCPAIWQDETHLRACLRRTVKTSDDKLRSVDFYLSGTGLFLFFKLRREYCDQAVSALVLMEGGSSGYSGKDGFVKGKVRRALKERGKQGVVWVKHNLVPNGDSGSGNGKDRKNWRAISEVVMKAAMGQ